MPLCKQRQCEIRASWRNHRVSLRGVHLVSIPKRRLQPDRMTSKYEEEWNIILYWHVWLHYMHDRELEHRTSSMIFVNNSMFEACLIMSR